jgi:hypothetical protein
VGEAGRNACQQMARSGMADWGRIPLNRMSTACDDLNVNDERFLVVRSVTGPKRARLCCVTLAS